MNFLVIFMMDKKKYLIIRQIVFYFQKIDCKYIGKHLMKVYPKIRHIYRSSTNKIDAGWERMGKQNSYFGQDNFYNALHFKWIFRDSVIL